MFTISGRNKKIIQDILAQADVQVGGSRPWDIQVHDERLYGAVIRQGALGLGEAYMNGWWDCAQVELFLARLLDGDLANKVKTPKMIARLLLSKLINFQTRERSTHVARLHYDIEPELYERMLDPYMNYTCGYWPQADNLDDAQRAKMDLICRKLKLQPGMKLLDIGCGWGGFARFAAENYGVTVVGITLSNEQAKYARGFCRDVPVEIRVQDYRDLDGTYDRISAIGMFEHVGCRNYAVYMKKIADNLVDDGLFLLQTNGMNSRTHGIDEWICKYIFPNAMLPTSEEMSRSFTGRLTLEDWHNLGDDYIKTLRAWQQNFVAGWSEFSDRYDETFYRMWNYFLCYFMGGYQARYIQLWQIVLSKTSGHRDYRSVR